MSGVTTATVIAGAGLATSVAGTAMSAIGQGQAASAQAAAQSQAASYQAQVARNAQTVANWNADNARKVGIINEDQQRQKTGLISGAQKAALAAQGGDVTSGSAVDILGDTARAGEMDAQTIRSNAARTAWGYQVQASGAGAQAGLLDMQSQVAANSTANLPFGIGSTLLGGASSVASKWQAFSANNPSGPNSYASISGLMADQGIG